ncbi:hypothetical protein BpHYR1_006831 [Brachionus plicatilis]|uniref:Uncharacterized protein n=1 Tax=Brachionus plicatilis TaxID=10195 RepID=A0A3M7QQD2_BRAPC|nr:hypothetical protein BpHYR1_006831 [Brachionus plicatilis]
MRATSNQILKETKGTAVISAINRRVDYYIKLLFSLCTIIFLIIFFVIRMLTKPEETTLITKYTHKLLCDLKINVQAAPQARLKFSPTMV